MTDFDLIWAQYPRKTNKQTARKAWAKLNPDTQTVQAMIDALAWQTKTDQWRRGVIPHFSTWLNQARWEDERPSVAPDWRTATPGQAEQDELMAKIRTLMQGGMSRQDAIANASADRAQTFRPAWEGKVH